MFNTAFYQSLDAAQKEEFQYAIIRARLVQEGFVDVDRHRNDWNWADFTMRKVGERDSIKVQQKGNMEVHEKYLGKGIWMCWIEKDSGDIYLVPHDELKQILSEIHPYFESASYKKQDWYNFPSMSKDQKLALEQFVYPSSESKLIEKINEFNKSYKEEVGKLDRRRGAEPNADLSLQESICDKMYAKLVGMMEALELMTGCEWHLDQRLVL